MCSTEFNNGENSSGLTISVSNNINYDNQDLVSEIVVDCVDKAKSSSFGSSKSITRINDQNNEYEIVADANLQVIEAETHFLVGSNSLENVSSTEGSI